MTFPSRLLHLTLAAALSASIAACGTTTTDRAVSGGAMGALGGAAIGSMTGSAGTGLVIGAVAGAAAGALTDPCKVSFGDPVWRDKNATREDYYKRCGHYPN
jgi:uncharacterized membrane protein